jgi:hypothetical protein
VDVVHDAAPALQLGSAAATAKEEGLDAAANAAAQTVEAGQQPAAAATTAAAAAAAPVAPAPVQRRLHMLPYARPALTLASSSCDAASKAQLQELYDAEAGVPMPRGFTKQQLIVALQQMQRERPTSVLPASSHPDQR